MLPLIQFPPFATPPLFKLTLYPKHLPLFFFPIVPFIFLPQLHSGVYFSPTFGPLPSVSSIFMSSYASAPLQLWWRFGKSPSRPFFSPAYTFFSLASFRLAPHWVLILAVRQNFPPLGGPLKFSAIHPTASPRMIRCSSLIFL